MATSVGGGAGDPVVEPVAATTPCPATTPYQPAPPPAERTLVEAPLADIEVIEKFAATVRPEAPRYDPAHGREDMRGHIAKVLVWALVLFLGFALLSSWIFMVPENRAALHDVLQLIIGPMIGLVGAVVGFYFGEKSEKR